MTNGPIRQAALASRALYNELESAGVQTIDVGPNVDADGNVFVEITLTDTQALHLRHLVEKGRRATP